MAFGLLLELYTYIFIYIVAACKDAAVNSCQELSPRRVSVSVVYAFLVFKLHYSGIEGRTADGCWIIGSRTVTVRRIQQPLLCLWRTGVILLQQKLSVMLNSLQVCVLLGDTGGDTGKNCTATKKIITFIITGLKHLANNRSNYKYVASASWPKSSWFLLAWRTVHQSHSICYRFQNKRIVSLDRFN